MPTPLDKALNSKVDENYFHHYMFSYLHMPCWGWGHYDSSNQLRSRMHVVIEGVPWDAYFR